MPHETLPGNPFSGPGEMRALGRQYHWGLTPLGPLEQWPHALRTIVRACMDSPFAMNLWCGPELNLIYNDAYRHILGSKHPDALGRPGREVWKEIWPQIGPLFDDIRQGGAPVYAEDAPFTMVRGGEDEPTGADGPNAWVTFSLSAIRDDEGEIVAFLNIVSESTGRVLAERERRAALARVERAEARMQEVFSQAPAFMALLRGKDHVLEYVNEACYSLVGYRDLLGRPVFEAIPELRGQGFPELLQSVIESREPYIGRELPAVLARDPEGEPERRFVDFIFYPLTDPHDGDGSAIVIHGHDVTQHVKVRQEAQRKRIARRVSSWRTCRTRSGPR